jgi:predicted CopG family antitoxin
MKAITIRGIDATVSEKLKQTAKKEGKSINQLVLDLIRQNVGMQKKKKFTRQYDDLDHLFGKWSGAEFEKIKSLIENQRKIDPELWQ